MAWRLFLAALALWPAFAFQGATAAEPSSQPTGTYVVVKAGGAKVFRGRGTAAAILPEGMMVDVLLAKDSWLRVNRGWIARGDVLPCEEAIALFSRRIAKRPDAPTFSHRSRIWCYYGDFEKALDDADAALRLDSQCASAWCNRGRAQAGLADVDRAIASFTKAAELDPKLAMAYCYRGRAWTEKGDLAQACADCDRALALDPHSNVAFYYRGRARARLGRSTEAIADFSKAIKLHSRYVPALNDRGIEYCRQRQYARAIADFDAAVKADPQFDLVHIHYNRGNAWFALGEHRRALADYRVSLRHESNYGPAIQAMAACYAHQGSYEEAVEWQRRAVAAGDEANQQDLLATLEHYSNRAAADQDGQEF